MTAAAVMEWLGGRRVLRGELRSDLDVLAAIERGLPLASLDAVAESGGLDREEIETLVIPRRTLAYRQKHRQRLTRDESDRLARIARVTTRAQETFGSPALAARWLRRDNRALGKRMPLELLATSEGAVLVEAVLGRIDDGVYE